MRVTYDPKKNRAYIYLREFDEGEDSRQYDVGGPQMSGSFTLDFDRAGRLYWTRSLFSQGSASGRVPWRRGGI